MPSPKNAEWISPDPDAPTPGAEGRQKGVSREHHGVEHASIPEALRHLETPGRGLEEGGSQGQTPESHLKHEPCSRQWSQEQKCCGLQASQYSQSAHFSQASHPQGPVVGFVSFVIRQIYMPERALSRVYSLVTWSNFDAL